MQKRVCWLGTGRRVLVRSHRRVRTDGSAGHSLHRLSAAPDQGQPFSAPSCGPGGDSRGDPFSSQRGDSCPKPTSAWVRAWLNPCWRTRAELLHLLQHPWVQPICQHCLERPRGAPCRQHRCTALHCAQPDVGETPSRGLPTHTCACSACTR